MHDPPYLRKVVVQHRILTEGLGDRPDRRLARQCDEIVARCPEVEAEREEQLASPWIRAMRGSGISEWYDPDWLEQYVDRRLNPPDPYSPDELRIRNIADMLEAGASLTISELGSGENVERRAGRSARRGAAGTN